MLILKLVDTEICLRILIRICSHCNSGAVGDEMHFLLFCDKFHCERQAMLEVINEECANFSRLLDWDKYG